MIRENHLDERMIPMKTSTFTEEQIVQILREAETGARTIGRVCHARGISQNTFYTWRKKYGGVDVAAIKRLRERVPLGTGKCAPQAHPGRARS
jgi:transposase-like protein